MNEKKENNDIFDQKEATNKFASSFAASNTREKYLDSLTNNPVPPVDNDINNPAIDNSNPFRKYDIEHPDLSIDGKVYNYNIPRNHQICNGKSRRQILILV